MLFCCHLVAVSHSTSHDQTLFMNQTGIAFPLWQVQTEIPNLMATLCYTEHVDIARIWTQNLTSYFCIGQEF